ncbi:MAG: hypothetical protein OES18_10935 [Deltaproteobacteria bacterium]|nr:hypothetical protein [Deltaproteobacteria bacterium]
MMRSRREAGNGLSSGYKKAEEVARKKVAFLPYPTSLQGVDRRKLGWYVSCYFSLMIRRS